MTITQQNSDQSRTTVNSYLYNGQQYDANTGFYYLRARYMNPSTGTFISMDPAQGSIFDPVSLHKYLYANANPIMNSDPSGRETLGELATAMAIDAIIEGAIGGTIGAIISSLEYVTHGGAFFSQGNLNAINNGLKSGFLLGFGLGLLGQILNIFLFTLIVAAIGLYTINYGIERIQEGDYGWGVFYIVAGLAGMGLQVFHIYKSYFANAGATTAGDSTAGSGGSGGSGNNDPIEPPTNRNEPRNNFIGPREENTQLHHELPWSLRKYFADKGLNVNDPQFMSWVTGGGNGGHQSWSWAYNNAWNIFIKENPEATTIDILAFLETLRGNSTYGG